MPTPKRGLGKGLQALIPAAESDGGLLEVALDEIRPNPHQPRGTLREQDLVELAASIQAHGIIQPLVVTRDAQGYQLIAGERRWRAARIAGLSRVPVVVKDVAPQGMLELALVENLQREDLNPLEEALAYRQLVDEFGLTHEEVARRVGKSRTAVTNTLRLLRAADEVKEALLDGTISEGHARALLALEKPEEQVSALRLVLRRDLTVRQAEELVQRLQSVTAAPRSASPALPEVQAVEDRFRAALGTRVLLRKGKKGGRLVIYFYSDEELEQIYGQIVGE